MQKGYTKTLKNKYSCNEEGAKYTGQSLPAICTISSKISLKELMLGTSWKTFRGHVAGVKAFWKLGKLQPQILVKGARDQRTLVGHLGRDRERESRISWLRELAD